MRVAPLILGIVELVAGASLAERIIDPFERHGADYVLEGPQHPSEVFYVSSNYYDAQGGKHNDRAGDILLLLTVTSAVGALATRSSEPELVAIDHEV